MDVAFSNEFKRDRDSYSGDDELMRQIAGKIKEIKKASSIDEVPGMEEIRGRKVFYRFKITSRKIIFRICVKTLHNKVWFTIIDPYKKRFYERI